MQLRTFQTIRNRLPTKCKWIDTLHKCMLCYFRRPFCCIYSGLFIFFETKYVDVRFAIMTQHQSIPIGDTVQNPCSTISYTSDSSGLEINMKLWIGLVGIYNSE